jgi:uncharacterized cupin superfamily protein
MRELEIFNIRNLEHKQMSSKKTGEHFFLSAVISSIYNFKDLFISHEILLPGNKSSRSHAHSHKEEMVFVLVGKPTIYLGSNSGQLNPGDFFGFVPATEPHYRSGRRARSPSPHTTWHTEPYQGGW